jgi:hypothetical protein
VLISTNCLKMSCAIVRMAWSLSAADQADCRDPVQITNAIDFQQARYVNEISHGQKNQDVANARPSQSNYTVNRAAARPPSPVTNAIVEA